MDLRGTVDLAHRCLFWEASRLPYVNRSVAISCREESIERHLLAWIPVIAAAILLGVAVPLLDALQVVASVSLLVPLLVGLPALGRASPVSYAELMLAAV